MRIALVTACLLLLAAGSGRAQTPDFLTGEALNAPVVKNAPFSAESLVTVKTTLFDGTQMERSVRAKQYRDSAGRVRREQTVIGLDVLNPSKDWQAIVTIIDPVGGFIYTIIPGTQTAQRMAIPTPFPAPPPLPSLPAPAEEKLGVRDIDGVKAEGSRTKTTIPTGTIGNDRPIEITDERWIATDLKILVVSRHQDPRSGDVEYRLIGISRSEPAADLFRVPAGYKIVDIPPRTAAARTSIGANANANRDAQTRRVPLQGFHEGTELSAAGTCPGDRIKPSRSERENDHSRDRHLLSVGRD